MKALTTFGLFLCLLGFETTIGQTPAQRALLYADSLLNSYRTSNFDTYSSLSYPGIVSYYGGSKNFREYVERSKSFEGEASAQHDQLQVVQLELRNKEGQCVIQRVHESVIDGKRALIISYMIGQSLDAGISWKMFDVALNSVDNLSWIMPDIFENISVPMRQVIYQNSDTGS